MLITPVPSPWKDIREVIRSSLLKLISNPYINEIASLDHKILDDSVEIRAFKSKRDTILAQFSSAKLSEILCCLRNDISE